MLKISIITISVIVTVIIFGIFVGFYDIVIPESFATPPCHPVIDVLLLRSDFVIGETTKFEFIDRVSDSDFPHTSWKIHYKTIDNFGRFQDDAFVVHETKSVYFKANENKFGKQFLLFLTKSGDNTYYIERCTPTIDLQFSGDYAEYYLNLIHDQNDIPKPLEQNRNHISLSEFQCRYGKIPLLMYDNEIVCMNYDSIKKIYSRGILHDDNFQVDIITDKEEYDITDTINISIKSSGVLPISGTLKLYGYGEELFNKKITLHKQSGQMYNFTWKPVSMNEYQDGTYLLHLDMKTFVGDINLKKEIQKISLSN